jgi:hypothetical protein
MDSVSGDALPSDVHRRREFVEALAGQARLWAGAAGTVTVTKENDDFVFASLPVSDAAAAVWGAASEWIDVQVGTSNHSRWKFGYTDEDMSAVCDLVRAVFGGGATEFRAFGRSQVEVSSLTGTLRSKTGLETYWGLIPAPGWRQWGQRRTFRAYAGQGRI